MSKAPGVDAVGLPHLCRFLVRFLEAKLVTQLFGFPSLFRQHWSKPRELPIKPPLADFKRRKALIPSSPARRLNFNVLDHEGCDRIEGEEPTA
jgi:hypothetical protein